MAPPKYQKFPSKEERKELIEKLMQEAQAGNISSVGEHYKGYIDSLKQLNDTMSVTILPMKTALCRFWRKSRKKT